MNEKYGQPFTTEDGKQLEISPVAGATAIRTIASNSLLSGEDLHNSQEYALSIIQEGYCDLYGYLSTTKRKIFESTGETIIQLWTASKLNPEQLYGILTEEGKINENLSSKEIASARLNDPDYFKIMEKAISNLETQLESLPLDNKSKNLLVDVFQNLKFGTLVVGANDGKPYGFSRRQEISIFPETSDDFISHLEKLINKLRGIYQSYVRVHGNESKMSLSFNEGEFGYHDGTGLRITKDHKEAFLHR